MRTLLLTLSMLLLTAALPVRAQQVALAGLVEGEQYTLIEDGKPYRPQPGKIEVVEVFAYWCPHCADMDPKLQTWKATLPKSVVVTYMPAAFHDDDPFMLGFFAAEQAKAVPLTHARMFAAIHDTGKLPRNAKLDQVAAFYARSPGINATAFKAALADTATLQAKAEVARTFQVRSKIPGTPSIVVDGRYMILGNSYETLLGNARKVIDAIAASRKPVGKTRSKPRS
ncbi:MAG: thiol:disulfide interchange protein DsbA/DsbL [Thermomonas sp.]